MYSLGSVCGGMNYIELSCLSLNASNRMDAILKEHKDADALPPAASAEFQDETFKMLGLVKFAARKAVEADPPMRLFNITLKSHYLCHIAVNSRWLNPRLGWCYAGEDLMQKMKKLAATSCKARNHITTFEKMHDKYLHALHYEFSRGRMR